ncbi:MAG: DegQ family serine endoprotease [Betaproteobacteria bacterium]|nr:MAG: DegQ family serine endoprotease [Betaproteobacteria bacterium]
MNAFVPVLAAFAVLVSAPAAAQPASSATQGASAPSRPSNLPDFTALVKKQGPAVVNVTTKISGKERRLSPEEEFFRRFMPDLPDRGGQSPEGVGLASGFIISEDGYILTNAHVVAEADEVTVRMADAKREFKAKVVGSDERSDVALLKVDQKGLPVAKLGKSSTLQPGEWVAAIGSPFGFANTITAGIVSATERSLPSETYMPFIQTDVAVNPGNSGGPLLNLDGEVVGINSMIYSRTGGYMGVSFAIPIEAALDVSRQLREHGKVTRGRLGIGIQPLTKELAETFKLDSTDGVVVVNVESGSPAEKAGLQVGDVILAYNGKRIEEADMLPRLVAATKPGEQAKLEVLRKGERQSLTASVGEIPAKSSARVGKSSEKEATPSRLGLAVRELTPQERKQLGVEYGVVVVDVAQGPAGRSAIQPGDVIVAVNQTRFSSLEGFTKLISEQKKGAKVALLVRRGEASIYVPIEVG